MPSIARTLGLFAPLLLTLAVAVAVVLAIFHATAVLVVLAGATVLFVLGAIVSAVVLQARRGDGRRPAPGAAVRLAVAKVARAPGDPGSRRQLGAHLGELDEVRAALEDRPPGEREIVRGVLHEIGAALRLQKVATDGGKWERVGAARNLAWLAPPGVAARLELLARDDDPDVALAAASGLAALPDPASYRALLGLLADGPLPASRTAAILEESAYPDPVGILLDEVPEGPVRVRFWGAYLAGRTGDRRAFDLLTHLAADDDPNVRANAGEALAALAVEAAVPTLLRLSRDDVWYVRAHAGRALGDRGHAGIDRLTELLADENWWVRENAARSLSSIGAPAIPALRRALTSEDRFARNKAGEVLVGLGYVEREMRTYLEGNGQRWHARDSLVLLGRAEVLASLSSRFLSAEEERRMELARVLIEIDDPRLRPTLRALAGTGATADEEESSP